MRFSQKEPRLSVLRLVLASILASRHHILEHREPVLDLRLAPQPLRLSTDCRGLFLGHGTRLHHPINEGVQVQSQLLIDVDDVGGGRRQRRLVVQFPRQILRVGEKRQAIVVLFNESETLRIFEILVLVCLLNGFVLSTLLERYGLFSKRGGVLSEREKGCLFCETQ